MLYFAYASNLSKEYMLSRCPNAIPLKRAQLKNYKLIFNQLGDIVESEGDTVYGAIYVVSKGDLQELDNLEGYPTLYDRLVVEVEDDNGNLYDVIVYYMPEKEQEAPPEHYVKILAKGLEDWEISNEYLSRALELED